MKKAKREKRKEAVCPPPPPAAAELASGVLAVNGEEKEGPS